LDLKIKLYTSRHNSGKLQAFFKHVSTRPRYFLESWKLAFPDASYCYALFKELSSLRKQKNTPVPQAHID
jgi:hypothetical protein